jgi:NAD(P)-dependent dehydrogenase (short-subunit alcohol dehydrogenase family)
MAVPENLPAVLVTGASRGLGRAIAFRVAEAGFAVWAGVRTAAAAAELTAAARERSLPLRTVLLDVTDKAGIREACNEIRRVEGRLYGLINNAGITGRAFFEDYPEEYIRRVFDVNLFGPMNVIRGALPLLRANGSGRIVNISSIGGRIGSNSVAPYVASKFGLEGFSESLSLELRPFHVYVSVISPGVVRTQIWDEENRILPEARNARSPYYRYFWRMEGAAEKLLASATVTPDDVAKRVLFVLRAARPRLRYVVGRRASLVAFLRKHVPDRLFEELYFGTIVRMMQSGRRDRPIETAPQENLR